MTRLRHLPENQRIGRRAGVLRASMLGLASAGSVWIVVGGGLVFWYQHRLREARRILRGEDAPKPGLQQADTVRTRLVRDAFLVGALWLALFVLLDWLS